MVQRGGSCRARSAHGKNSDIFAETWGTDPNQLHFFYACERQKTQPKLPNTYILFLFASLRSGLFQFLKFYGSAVPHNIIPGLHFDKSDSVVSRYVRCWPLSDLYSQEATHLEHPRLDFSLKFLDQNLDFWNSPNQFPCRETGADIPNFLAPRIRSALDRRPPLSSLRYHNFGDFIILGQFLWFIPLNFFPRVLLTCKIDFLLQYVA